ncbi:methyltransferase domain-containing protein [Pontibacter sp. G13]|uniref:class I SAM-dependent methyltransferase n=1 Tax=Pontibacter sp. G13 TaxID=3074898 RepID=UPI0028891508|nr:methyltransferase domain-containing protein [Pontibacter sp. G13]WNJ18106.1 methyltransferase domain-containing protein [Pontibacter sp. G13]
MATTTTDQGFDRVAPFYDQLAHWVFGEALRQSQRVFLRDIPRGSRVLILGGGSGWILEDMASSCQPKEIVYLEASKGMMSLTEQVVEKLSDQWDCQVELRCGNEELIGSFETFDVIFTGFFLDLFESPRFDQIVDQLYGVLEVGGKWVFADFQKSPARSWWQRNLVKIMYAFFRALCGIEAKELPDFEGKFEEKGLWVWKEAWFFQDMICSQLLVKRPER